jgi:uncharacterized membrane protein
VEAVAVVASKRPIAPPRRQRGVAAVFAAGGIVAGIAALGFALDLGRLYYTQRSMQRMTNLAALDAARVTGGCLALPADPQQTAFNEARDAVERNGGEASWVLSENVQIGRRTVVDGVRYFEATTGGVKHSAVQVRLQRPMPTRLIPLPGGGGSGQLTAVAAAESRPQASVSVGTGVASFDPVLLNNFFDQAFNDGDGVNLDAITYQNLFSAEIRIGDFVEAQVSGGSAGEVLRDTITVPGFLRALADALGAAGNSAAAAAADALADGADTALTLVPAEILGIEEGFEDPATQALVNVGQIINAAAQAVATGVLNLPIALPPPLPDATAQVNIREPSRSAVLTPGGPLSPGDENFARNTQVVVEGQAPLTVNVLGLTSVELPFFVQGAQATAEVDDIACARRGQENDIVTVGARSSITRFGVGEFDNPNAPNPSPQPSTILDTNSTVTVTNALGIPVTVPVRVVATGSAYGNLGSNQNQELIYEGPFDGVNDTQRLGTPPPSAIAAGMAEALSDLEVDVEATVIGPLDPLLKPLVDAEIAKLEAAVDNALTDAINSQFPSRMDAVFNAASPLGLTLGGADVTVHSVFASPPRLFTR